MSQQRTPVVVREIRKETNDIKSFFLAKIDGTALPSFKPGDHIDIELQEGTVRQYSLCNGPLEIDTYHISVKKEINSRGGSRALHENVKEGDILHISSPRTNFPLTAEAAHHVFIAGGIGITPILSMLRHLQHENRSHELHYFTRTELDTPFLDELRVTPRSILHTGLDAEHTKEQLIKILSSPQNGAHLFFCGPAPFMSAIQALAPTLGWPADCIHYEYFAPPDTSTEKANTSFQVYLIKSQRTLDVPADKTILETLRACNVSAESSCELGTCGACVVKVIEGTPDHRDSFLSDFQKKSGKKIAVCVSRSLSPLLTIDL